MSEKSALMRLSSLHISILACSLLGVTGSACDLGATGATLESIEIELEHPEMLVDDRQRPGLMLRYDDAFQERVSDDITWSTDDPGVVAIDGGTELRAVRVGTANITARYEGLEATAVVKVDGIPQSLRIRSIQRHVPTGLTLQHSAILQYRHGQEVDATELVEWISSVPAVASIDPTGIVTGLAPGRTMITASAFELSVTQELDVKEAVVVSISLDPTTLMLAAGEIGTLTATGTYSDGNVLDITHSARWESSLSAAVKVNYMGQVEALAPGDVLISASKDNMYATVAVTATR